MSFSDFITNLFLTSKERTKKKQKLIKDYELMAHNCQNAKYQLLGPVEFGKYIDFEKKENWKSEYSNLYKRVAKDTKYKNINIHKDLIDSIITFKITYKNLDELRNNNNDRFVKNEISICESLFDNIEKRALDHQQRECIVKDEVNNLVIAGAGSGKTTTIVGKVKYLLKRYSYNPGEILVLSFTNASASEMADRIRSETGEHIDVMTFHKLGLNIISQVEGKRPSLFQTELYDFVAEQFNKLTKQPKYNDMVNKYFLAYLKQYKSRFDFKNEGEYIEYLRDADIRTLKGEKVKSFEEMEIANFLLLNHINYEYEKKYEYDTRDMDHRQYTPDFYLPDYGIYIEHFGISREGNVPAFFRGKDGMTAKESYNSSIRWKHETHKKYNTKLVETYSYEKAEGVLTDNLRNKLESMGVRFNPMPRYEVWNMIEDSNKGELSSFMSLMSTFINQLKSNSFSIEKIKALNRKYFKQYEMLRNDAFIDLISPIFKEYYDTLTKSGDIDFHDMINRATQYVSEGRYTKTYSYIIVDEYQDISLPRYKLIKAIKDPNNAKLFCVGDDWQSIYRFAGSRVNLFTGFEKYYGFTEKSYIETTYRFNNKIITLSGNFILKNKSQIKKSLKPYKEDGKDSFELVYGKNSIELSSLIKQRLDGLPQNSSVIFLGRYNHKIDLEPYLDRELTCRYTPSSRDCLVNYSKRSDLNIKFYTVHRSKGLQADYVFILNNTHKRLGFPSQIEDDPILNLFIEENEAYNFAEERRLFYVALTRAKKHVYLMVDSTSKSAFIREIEEDYHIRPLSEQSGPNCPWCKKGKLELRRGQYGDFYGCSNFPYCTYTEKATANRQNDSTHFHR